MRITALTIAGSDPSGGAGLQADIKVFAAMGVYGMAVPAALTVQNTRGVSAVKAVPSAFVEAQLDTLLNDIVPDAVKTGMLLSAGNVKAAASLLKKYALKNIVVDPVSISTSGKRLLRRDALNALVETLFPLATLVTPNADEASALAGMRVATPEDAKNAARAIKSLGPRYVLVKGGHLEGEPVDVLFDGRRFHEFPGRRADVDLHGAGCVYSAAIAAGLAKGLDVAEAVGEAKRFIEEAVGRAVSPGKGRATLV